MLRVSASRLLVALLDASACRSLLHSCNCLLQLWLIAPNQTVVAASSSVLLQMSAASPDYHDPRSLRQERGGGNAGPMGVTSKAAANDRLAALKAELAKEVRLPGRSHSLSCAPGRVRRYITPYV
jgi:hypothetical protein